MKKKILMLLCTICFLVPLSYILTGCNNHTHTFNEWETRSVATCNSLEEQMRVCEGCGQREYREVGSYLEHTFDEWETRSVATCNSLEEQMRVCEGCGQREYREVGSCLEHIFDEWETASVQCGQELRQVRHCINCNIEDYKYEGTKNHSFTELKYLNDKISHICTDCALNEEIDFSTTFFADENGSVELIEVYEDCIYVKPVPKSGYYFLKWETNMPVVDGEGNKDYNIYYAVLNAQIQFDEDFYYKAIFTNDVSLIQPITLNVEVENDLDVDIEYLPYVTKEEQCFSYFIHGNDNLVLSHYSSFIRNSLGGVNNMLVHLDERDVTILPYHSARWYSSFVDENNNLESVTLQFSDIRNKYLLTLDEIGIVNEEICIICDKNEKVTINTKGLCRAGCFEYWQDNNGKIISNQEEFNYKITENTTIYLNTDECDILTYYKGNQFSFKVNEDDSLTLYSFAYDQLDTVEIPSVVEGKIVTTIGLLHANGFGGELIIPDTVVNFEPNAFKYLGIDSGYKPTISFASERQDLEASDFYGCCDKVLFDFTENTIKSIVINELHKLTKNSINLNVIFSDEMEENVLGFYTQGTQNITLSKLPVGSKYNRNILNVIVHELRHYYQAISVGDVSGFTIDDLAVIPSDNELGAWKYLEYTESSEDYNKYYYNAREVDSREYAELITGFYLG